MNVKEHKRIIVISREQLIQALSVKQQRQGHARQAVSDLHGQFVMNKLSQCSWRRNSWCVLCRRSWILGAPENRRHAHGTSKVTKVQWANAGMKAGLEGFVKSKTVTHCPEPHSLDLRHSRWCDQKFKSRPPVLHQHWIFMREILVYRAIHMTENNFSMINNAPSIKSATILD